MTTISFNGDDEGIGSIEALRAALDRFDRHEMFEVWASEKGGPSLCMLRHGERAFLTYLRFPGDSGFTSVGETASDGTVEYQLSNGQLDQYPASWCVPVEQCYKAMAFFFVDEGQRPEWLTWHESSASLRGVA